MLDIFKIKRADCLDDIAVCEEELREAEEDLREAKLKLKLLDELICEVDAAAEDTETAPDVDNGSVAIYP